MIETPRRTKTYIAFDGDADLMSYRTIQKWIADPTDTFNINNAHDMNFANDDSLPESIIKQLKERLDASKHLILLVGSKTNKNRKGILKYELNYALRHQLPIFLTFIGFNIITVASDELWSKQLMPLIPAVIRDYDETKYCLVCPFTKNAVQNATETYSNNNLPNTKAYMWFWK